MYSKGRIGINVQTFTWTQAKGRISSSARGNRRSHCFLQAGSGLTAWLLTQTSQSCQTQELLLAQCSTERTLSSRSRTAHRLLLVSLPVVPILMREGQVHAWRISVLLLLPWHLADRQALEHAAVERKRRSPQKEAKRSGIVPGTAADV